MTVTRRAANWLEKLSIALLVFGAAGDIIWNGPVTQGAVCLLSGFFWGCVSLWLTRLDGKIYRKEGQR